MEPTIKRKKIWQLTYPIRFLHYVYIIMIVLMLLGIIPIIRILVEIGDNYLFWGVMHVAPYVFFSLACLVCILTMLHVLYRSLGPLPRIHKLLDEIIQGNYSLRIKLRDKDFLNPLATRLNKILELLEEVKKKG